MTLVLPTAFPSQIQTQQVPAPGKKGTLSQWKAEQWELSDSFWGNPEFMQHEEGYGVCQLLPRSCILSRDSHLPRAPLKKGCSRSRWSLLSSAALSVFSCGTAAVSWEPCTGHLRLRDTSCCWECFAGVPWAPRCVSRLLLAMGIW